MRCWLYFKYNVFLNHKLNTWTKLFDTYNIYATFREFGTEANHQTGEQMESIEVFVSGTSHIYNESVP